MANMDLEAWRRNPDAYQEAKAVNTLGEAVEKAVEIPTLLNLLGDIGGKKIADLGCGDGEFVEILAGEGANVIGVDGSEAQLARARNLFPERTFSLADLTKGLPFADQSFDAVTSRFTLMYLEDLDRRGQFVFTVVDPIYPYLQEIFGISHRYLDLPPYKYPGKGSIKFNEQLYPFYFRSIEDYIFSFIDFNFEFRGLEEIIPPDEILDKNPQLERMRGAPVFMIVNFFLAEWKRSNGSSRWTKFRKEFHKGLYTANFLP